MTNTEKIYAETLNLLGSDVLDATLQEIVDQEHAAADPGFKRELEKREALKVLTVN